MRGVSKKEIVNFGGQTNQEKFQKFYDYRPYVEKTIYNSGVTKNTYVCVQDILQEVFCKIWLEIDTYDLNKYAPFTYISKRTEAVIEDHRRKHNSQKRKPQDAVLYIDDEDIHWAEDEKDMMEDMVNKSIIDSVLEKLTDVESKIFKKRFEELDTMENIGRHFNVSKQRIFQIISKIEKKFKKETENVL